MSQQPANVHDHYHAHIYFDNATAEQADSLRLQAGDLFGVGVGRMHRQRVGPHLYWSCQLSFDRAQFDDLIPWLERHRNGLNILIHGRTGDDLADHTRYAYWLGKPCPLRLEVFT
ncbi:DOPA 4,5-dioxygenase family protein [Zobellella maritima]|uniref:DOPA 4,5-dioxygenase family protein n=1 Tax=Zobellella maritima TaxID=2059725 RepID=UPI000E30AA57|nr:DOPA 4,5-dioxygenase family protein [Zobellella maritima]